MQKSKTKIKNAKSIKLVIPYSKEVKVENSTKATEINPELSEYYKMLEALESRIFNWQRKKDKIVMYSYNFENDVINKILYDYIVSADPSPSVHSFIGILNGLGQIARGNLYAIAGYFFLSESYLTKFNDKTSVKHLRKIIEPWLTHRGSKWAKRANRYDFLRMYTCRNKYLPKIDENVGVILKPNKFIRATHKFFDTFANNKNLKNISYEDFVNGMKEVIEYSKVKESKKYKVTYDKSYSKVIEKHKLSIKTNKSNKNSKNLFSTKDLTNDLIEVNNRLKEQSKIVKRNKVLIPVKNVRKLNDEMNRTKKEYERLLNEETSTLEEFFEDLTDYMSNDNIETNIKNNNGKLFGLSKKLNRLRRDYKMYDFEHYENRIVTIKGNRYVSCTFNENIIENIGRNYHLIASTSKAGRKILFSDYYSIDVSNMAGKAIYEVITNFISPDSIPLFREFANNRDKFFKRFHTSIPNNLKIPVLKNIFLSMMFGKDLKLIINALIKGYDFKNIKEFKNTIRDIIFENLNGFFDEDSNLATEYTDTFLNDLISKDNIIFLAKFLTELELIAKTNKEIFNSNKEAKKSLSATFMRTESELIEDILYKINLHLKEDKYGRQAYRIHDEVIVPKMDKEIMKILIETFNGKELNIKDSVKTAKLAVKNFKSSVTKIETGKKLSLSVFSMKTLKDSIIEDMNIYNVKNVDKVFNKVELDFEYDLFIKDSFKIDKRIENKIYKILHKTITSITESDIQFLNSFIKNSLNDIKFDFFKNVLGISIIFSELAVSEVYKVEVFFNSKVISKSDDILYLEFINYHKIQLYLSYDSH